jgi:hypothetical protein
MGHERWFRGQHDGQGRPFDWLTPARQHGVPPNVARALYERAMQQAHGATQGRVQEIYLALLADARRQTPRPSPGKVTRTMRLQAQSAGRSRLSSSVSRLTGRPIAPCKVALTSYIDPAHGSAHGQRRETQVNEELTPLADAAPWAPSRDTRRNTKTRTRTQRCISSRPAWLWHSATSTHSMHMIARRSQTSTASTWTPHSRTCAGRSSWGMSWRTWCSSHRSTYRRRHRPRELPLTMTWAWSARPTRQANAQRGAK